MLTSFGVGWSSRLVLSVGLAMWNSSLHWSSSSLIYWGRLFVGAALSFADDRASPAPRLLGCLRFGLGPVRWLRELAGMTATRPNVRLRRFDAAVVRRRHDLAGEEIGDDFGGNQSFSANPQQLEQALPLPAEPR
jgi:hypothetical protein